MKVYDCSKCSLGPCVFQSPGFDNDDPYLLSCPGGGEAEWKVNVGKTDVANYDQKTDQINTVHRIPRHRFPQGTLTEIRAIREVSLRTLGAKNAGNKEETMSIVYSHAANKYIDMDSEETLTLTNNDTIPLADDQAIIEAMENGLVSQEDIDEYDLLELFS